MTYEQKWALVLVLNIITPILIVFILNNMDKRVREKWKKDQYNK
jgi:capsular polysaccharide biosynthesis protein